MDMIWLIGNKGMLGSKLQSFLQKERINFIGTDKEIDITDKDIILNYVNNNKKIDWIINCAAYTAVDLAEDEKDKALKLNRDAIENLVLVAKIKNCKIIHISTDYVFDGSKKSPYKEDDTPNPLNYYGVTKLEGEKILKEQFEDYFIVRTSWLYGEDGKNFVLTMIKLMNEREKINVVYDQVGTPTYTEDLAQFLLFLVKSNCNKFGIYHFSNEGETSWYEFAKKIYEFAKEKKIVKENVIISPIPTSEFPSKAKRPLYSVLSKEKVKSTFGYNIRNWDEALKECIMKYNESVNQGEKL